MWSSVAGAAAARRCARLRRVRSCLRLVLTWLLMLALPLQGLAASAMRPCPAVHDGAHDARAGIHVHDCAAAGAAARESSSLRSADSAPAAGGGAHGASMGCGDAAPVGCSSCSACCTAVAAPAAAPELAEPTPVARWPAVGFVQSPIFVTGGPERPPRSAVA